MVELTVAQAHTIVEEFPRRKKLSMRLEQEENGEISAILLGSPGKGNSGKVMIRIAPDGTKSTTA